MAETTPLQQDPVKVEADDETGSSLGDDASTTSTSLNSSALEYEYRHSRRYHGYRSGTYSFPNNAQEQDRLDIVHHGFFRLFNDKLLLAPIDLAGKRVLDIGTDQFPEAELITGNDLSPIQPSWTPPNVKFIVDDVEQDWVEPHSYDYIHYRYIAGSIINWPRLFKQIYDNLSPGGWVEFQESDNILVSEDGTLKPDNAVVKMMNGLMDACDKIGRNISPAPSFKKWAEDAGFDNVTQQTFKLPVGTWAKDQRLKECGLYARQNFLEGVQGFTAQLFKDLLNAGVRAAVRDNKVHALFNVVVVTAQKPDAHDWLVAKPSCVLECCLAMHREAPKHPGGDRVE
ncbi:S-adenosyl-L-methionine-dependent methyltransferase [Sodiomyces alkalinus F11]|uniref:S-adenosyl-L-methionine-dependent methyltransferase n=1 Tax=Sodiomyces alkalinus (strain CBS 110278 / VKM F-3762 / F11) TaxID=1314773 RepID=A0A3N2PRI7_SODAK|nr:S-adenosyl-L-methionine-dependent methyltransferase [Sodiomyces alkalinus F11]ROT37129.1 S-adenosyl-L-methionine-dependent methyltransferase [Sodiomyces alkalinus F11]